MKKKLAVIGIISALVLGLCACGGNDSKTGEQKSTEPEEITGEVISCEAFSALCPEGWANAPCEDIFAEEEGVLEPNILQFVKGGTDEEGEELTKASLTINCNAPDAAAFDLRDMYSNTKDVSFTVGDLTFEGYTGEFMGWTNLNATAKTDVCTWDISGGLEGGETSFKIDDPDFLAILESLTVLE